MSDSLISEVPQQTPEQVVEGMQSQQEGWFYADGVAGNGERPEYLLPKFKSVADQAKSYTELEKRFGGFKGAPENYEVTLPQELDGKIALNADDPLLKNFIEVAKSSNMSQETFNQIVASYANNIAQIAVNREAEIAKLGDGAQERLGRLGKWAQNNLSTEEVAVFQNMVTNAAAVQLFEKIKSKMSETSVPQVNARPAATMSEVHEMMRDPRYAAGDKNYRAAVQDKIRQITGED